MKKITTLGLALGFACRIGGLTPRRRSSSASAGPITGPNAADRRADEERRRAGRRRHQCGRRHPRPEDHASNSATTSPIPSRASRSPTISPATASSSSSATTIPASPSRPRKSIRRTASWRSRRPRPTRRSPTRHVEHLPHLRPRRSAGRGRRRLHPQRTSRARRSPSSTTRPPTARASPTRR